MKFEFPATSLYSNVRPAMGLWWQASFILFIGLAFCAPVTVFSQTEKPPATDQQEPWVTGDWLKIEPTGASASVEMPIKPRYIERIFSPIPDEPPIKVRIHLASLGEDALTCVFSYHDLFDKPDSTAKINATLDGAVNGSVANIMGQLATPEELGLKSNPVVVKKKNFLGRQYVCRFIREGKVHVVTAKVFLVGKRLYQLNCIMPEETYDAHLAAKFINSFELVESENDLPPRPRSRD